MIRVAIVLVALLSGMGNAAQDRPHTGTLIVVADPAKPLTLRPAELATMPRKTVTVKQQDGGAVASYVVASATDGYRAVFSLAELDPDFTGSEIMVVDRTNGQPLLADQGPIRMVAPHDLAGARSVRMLERIELVRLPKP